MITSPKQYITGLLQVVEHIRHDPADPLYGQCKHFNIFQKAAGKKNVWIEVANTLESALKPEMEMFYKPSQAHVGPEDMGRNDARCGYPASHNPYISKPMRAAWLAGWKSQQLTNSPTLS